MNLPGTEAIMEFTAAETSAGCQVALKTPPTAMWNLSRAFEQSVWSPILFFYRTLKKNIPSVQHSGVCRAHPGSWVSPFSERHSLSLGLMVLPLWSMECAQGFVCPALWGLPSASWLLGITLQWETLTKPRSDGIATVEHGVCTGLCVGCVSSSAMSDSLQPHGL